MRLLYVADRFPVLSETFVLNEVRGLLRAGDEVTVYARRVGDVGVADDLTHLVVGPGRAFALRGLVPAVRFRERGALHALAEAGWLARHVRADHVHSHFAFGNATIALLYGRLTGAPASITAHALDVYGGVPPAILRRKITASAFTAAVCEHSATHLRALAAPADQEKIVVQRNGVARDAVAAGEPESPPRVVAIARLTDKKGLDVLLRAAASVGRDVVVELVGDGPERVPLEGLAAEVGARVRFSGALDHPSTLQRLVGATAFALPCRELPSGDRDALPVALVEAMSAGVPVVTTPVGGIPELVRDGETGLLVPQDDAQALAAALARMLDDPALRIRLSAAGREATEPWDVDRCISELRARFS